MYPPLHCIACFCKIIQTIDAVIYLNALGQARVYNIHMCLPMCMLVIFWGGCTISICRPKIISRACTWKGHAGWCLQVLWYILLSDNDIIIIKMYNVMHLIMHAVHAVYEIMLALFPHCWCTCEIIGVLSHKWLSCMLMWCTLTLLGPWYISPMFMHARTVCIRLGYNEASSDYSYHTISLLQLQENIYVSHASYIAWFRCMTLSICVWYLLWHKKSK